MLQISTKYIATKPYWTIKFILQNTFAYFNILIQLMWQLCFAPYDRKQLLGAARKQGQNARAVCVRKSCDVSRGTHFVRGETRMIRAGRNDSKYTLPNENTLHNEHEIISCHLNSGSVQVYR